MSVEIEKNGHVSEIIFSERMSRLFNPLSSETLQLEQKLVGLEISPDHKIQGLTPIRNTRTRFKTP